MCHSIIHAKRQHYKRYHIVECGHWYDSQAIYYMWYYTGDPKYRRWAAEMFMAFNKHCKVLPSRQRPAAPQEGIRCIPPLLCSLGLLRQESGGGGVAANLLLLKGALWLQCHR